MVAAVVLIEAVGFLMFYASLMNAVVSFIRAVWLSFLLLFWPSKFKEEEDKHNELLNASPISEEIPPRDAFVRRALIYSFFLVLGAGLVGYVLGLLLEYVAGCSTATLIRWLQIIGAGFLLWSVLFIRGWEIQSWGGRTLSELANQWIYRVLQTIGTVVVILSLSWSQCPS